MSAFWMHNLRDSLRRSTDRLRRIKRKRKRLCQRKAKEWRSCGRSFKRKSKPAAEYFLPVHGELIMTPLAVSETGLSMFRPCKDSHVELAILDGSLPCSAAYGAMYENSI